MTREEAEELISGAFIKAHYRYITEFPMEYTAEAATDIERKELTNSILAAVVERDKAWREWIMRIESAFGEGPNMLFLEGYPPPDRQPSAEGAP